MKRENVEKFAHLAAFEQIENNEFNLNIPRYVDIADEEESINIEESLKELTSLEVKEKAIDSELENFLTELGISFK